MLVRTGLAILAKVILACNFAIIYSYTAELFPTMVRNSALGLCTMSSRLAGTLVPQITLLVNNMTHLLLLLHIYTYAAMQVLPSTGYTYYVTTNYCLEFH